MRLLNTKNVFGIALASAVTTFLGEHFGFMIVHSASLMLLVVVTSPGFLAAFFNLVPSDFATYVVTFAINAMYYAFALLVWHRWQVKRKEAVQP